MADVSTHESVNPQQTKLDIKGSGQQIIRPTQLLYPNGRGIDYNYGTTGGIDG